MDVDGLSEGTLKNLLEWGFVDCEADLYVLYKQAHLLQKHPGFGEKAVNKLLKAINESRNTTMEQFIIAMDIPLLGRHASKILCRHFDYSLADIAAAASFDFDFTQLEDFGDVLNDNIHEWFADGRNVSKWNHISSLMHFKRPASASVPPAAGNPFFGKTVVATGSFERFTRDSINEAITALGAKAGSSVSAKTDFVVAGEKAGSKKQKAETLGVRILTETEFVTMAGL